MKHELKKYFSVNPAKSLRPALDFADTPVSASCFDTTARGDTRGPHGSRASTSTAGLGRLDSEGGGGGRAEWLRMSCLAE